MEYYSAGVELESTRLLHMCDIYELYEILNKQGLYIIGGNFTELNKSIIATPAYENKRYEIGDMFIKAVNKLPEYYQDRFPETFYIFKEQYVSEHYILFVIKTEKFPAKRQENVKIIQNLKVWR